MDKILDSLDTENHEIKLNIDLENLETSSIDTQITTNNVKYNLMNEVPYFLMEEGEASGTTNNRNDDGDTPSEYAQKRGGEYANIKGKNKICEDCSNGLSMVKEASYTRLCKTKKILTVNGKFPGPTLYAYKGDTIIVNVRNKANQNITIHWHGVKLPRYPWSDGPEYVTQCPIQPGHTFRQKVIFSSEEGTLWWHAHSDWSRATVHGAVVVYPKIGTGYPFPKPDAEVLIILGEWWKKDVDEVLQLMLATGGDPNVSDDAFTINGQPGDFYPCSGPERTFKLNVDHGKTYLFRMVNADMNEIMFYKIAKHKLTVVGADASYTKPLKSKYVVLSPGQTLDCLLHANRRPGRYYMAARAYSSGIGVLFDNTITTAILQYNLNYDPSSSPIRPSLPYYNDTSSAFRFLGQLKSLNSDD
ncbi:hypothetical protein RJ640_022523 [Escallonia rubra]|uniref:laccase n=1 Tax=Escallonia rubra TaxID=112253 RepID=A0AA88UFT4_9ASTE|nr:hypothetical protein RJ640_022523 [Escallonia rubra]